MAGRHDCHGSLIALEGPRDVLLTQCRLLPSSPNILVLPELSQFLEPDPQDSDFDPASCVLKIHEACSARAEKAYSFLGESTPSRKRLVFMIGGTASAEKECIRKISDNSTQGGLAKAERIFDDLVRMGVSSLRRTIYARSNPDSATEWNAARSTNREDAADECESSILEDPIHEAMRAADELDRRTASLQPDNEIDLTIRALRRSRSMPLHLLLDFSSTAPRRIDKPSEDSNSDYESFDSDGADEGATLCAPSNHGPTTPKSVSFDSAPPTPTIIGEACVVDFRPIHSKLSPRPGAKLVDCLYASTIRNQDVSLCDASRSRSVKLNVSRDGIDIPQEQRNSWHGDPSKLPPASAASSNIRVRRGPPSPLDLSQSNKRLSSFANWRTNLRDDYAHQEPDSKLNYVEKGTNTVAVDILSKPNTSSSGPVLQMVEDMVIFFRDHRPDSLLEKILRDLKEGPPYVESPAHDSRYNDEVRHKDSDRPSPHPSSPSQRTRPQVAAAAGEGRSHHTNMDEYDPFASHGGYPRSPYSGSKKPNVSIAIPPIRPAIPPTPAHTPPPSRRIMSHTKRFFEVDTVRCRTVIDVQDSLRSILHTCFYAADARNRQLDFLFSPELDGGDWQPVFRYKEPDFSGIQRREIDLILAIGAQEGVDKEFVASLRGSMEALGTKPNGVTRSGRLDLRYLIANALKTSSPQLYSSQIAGNQPASPYLIATLIIPSLETYIAIHSETHFLLLEYPPEHLATVLALQEIVGDDLLKTAGILNDKLEEPRPWPGLRSLDMRSTSPHSPSGAGSFRTPSFSKTNFVVTSSAPESEIATTISSVWKILVGRSPFYIPDDAPKTSPITLNSRQGKAFGHPSSPLINLTIQYTPLDSAAAMMGFHGPTAQRPRSRESEDSQSTYLRTGTRSGSRPRSPPMSPAASSLTETVRSNITARTLRSKRAKLMNLLGRDPDAADDKMTPRADLSDEEANDDSGFAAEERKYIPLFMKSEDERKGNSRKALKFLGLSAEQ